MRLFAEIGYHTATNAVIADAAGLTRGAMLYHFATREELVEAAIAFIEVKARASLDEAAYAVTARQQARIINAAQAWLAAHPDHAELELRFDAILIAPRRLPRHLLAAFDASP